MTALSPLFFASVFAATPAPSTLDEVRRFLSAGDGEAAAAALHALLPWIADPDLANDARYLLGALLVAHGEKAGRAHLEALPDPWPPVEDRRLLRLARARELDGDAAGAVEAAKAALAHDLEESERGELRLLLARALDGLDRGDEAIRELARVAGGDGARHQIAAALRALALRSEGAVARGHARRLLVQYADTPAAAEAGLPVAVEGLTPQDRLERARTLISRFRHHEAREALRPLEADRAVGREATWLLGVVGLSKLRDDPAGARASFERVLGGPGREPGPHQEEALYSLLRTYVKEDRYKEALEVADRYDRRHPKGEFREAVAWYRAFLPYDERRCEEARPAMEKYVKRFGERRSYMRGFMAWCRIRDGEWKEAVRAFEDLVPIGGALTRGKAWYWQAYALDRLGRREDARAKLARLHADYPLTYYDVLGRQMEARWEGRDPRASALPWPDGGGLAAARDVPDPAVWDRPRLSGRQAERFARVRRLVALGEVDAARREYGAIRSAVEAAVPAALRLAFVHAMGHAVEDHKHGWTMVTGGAIGAMMPLDDPASVRWLLAYPRAFRPLVERLTRDTPVPAPFVWSIMRQESRYHPAQVSSADAVGALQMIPQTAELVAKEHDLEYDAATFPDPRVGFAYSVHYMARHLALFQGRLVPTAAAYNAGPEPVARWIREGGAGTEQAFVVEEITYNEARAYCRMVATHLLRYLWLYEPDPAKRAPILDALFPVDPFPIEALPEDVGY